MLPCGSILQHVYTMSKLLLGTQHESCPVQLKNNRILFLVVCPFVKNQNLGQRTVLTLGVTELGGMLDLIVNASGSFFDVRLALVTVKA